RGAGGGGVTAGEVVGAHGFGGADEGALVGVAGAVDVAAVGAGAEVAAGAAGEDEAHVVAAVFDGVAHFAGPEHDGLVEEGAVAVGRGERFELVGGVDELGAEPALEVGEAGAGVVAVGEGVVPIAGVADL